VIHSQHHESQQPPPPPRPPAGQDGPRAQSWTPLPPPPQQWHRSEESMRSWLQAKVEEEKTKQEEEKTRQESLRLEQRRVESELLQYSLRGGIPPPMIPLLFAGKTTGGALPQAAVDLAQQFLLLSPTQQLQHSSAQRQHSPDSHQRDGDTRDPSPEATAKLAPLPGTGGYSPYPASPTRLRGQTMSVVAGRTNMSNVGVNMSQSGQSGAAGVSPYGCQAHMHSQSPTRESSPGLSFHHWQPPATQSGYGRSNRPGNHSGAFKPERKGDLLWINN
jgi:hypothetical protein